MSEASLPRVTAAWTVGISFVLLAILSAYSAIFYAWIDVSAPGHGRLNHAMGIVCLVAALLSIVGAVAVPRLILRPRAERAGRSR
jgi:hypothetical protein